LEVAVQAATRTVDQAVAQLVVAGVKTTGEVLDASEERTAEAIMGARHAAGGAVHRAGRGRLAMLLRPTVAERVYHYPCCPVLVAP
jgi:nucleotide-binding universal stress UspA family protein